MSTMSTMPTSMSTSLHKKQQLLKTNVHSPYLDPPPINNGNRCNGKHGDGQEDGADEDGQEVVVGDLVPRLHNSVGGEVVERADGVAGVAAQRGRSLRRPEVGVQVPVDTFLFDIVLNGEMPEGDVDPFR